MHHVMAPNTYIVHIEYTPSVYTHPNKVFPQFFA